ncbi:MAG TPA: potassium transporter Kup, partial [Sorangium sp.]|nr:potassium transporter Kup [Sorangium sp.]
MDETGDDAPARTDPEADAVPKIASPTPAANTDAPRSPAPGASEQAQPSAETETDEEASGGEHGHGHGGPVHGKRLLSLSLLALGVVYGDIGTSPLYAIRECLHGEHHMALTEANIMGVLSLIVWSLTVVISLKYLVYVLRADNQGEGGILALMALALSQPVKSALRTAIVMLGLFGAALLYGDGVITPAISVLSAVEGLGVAAPGLKTYIVPITIAILIGLFWIQKRGTALVGALFGPVTLLWFSVLALLGLVHIAQLPKVLWALSPTYAVSFFLNNGSDGILVLGGVFLAVTGGEALYADMGHFGVKPIRLTWFGLVFPALII